MIGPVKRAVLVLVALALLCAAAAPAARDSGVAVVKAAYNAKLKRPVLVNARGLTLYLFDADAGGSNSACVNDAVYHCSKAWPPLLTTGDPQAKDGAKAALLGTMPRDDGTTQVTYAGHRLYTFAGFKPTPPDRKPGVINGQGYVGLWWLATGGLGGVHRGFPAPPDVSADLAQLARTQALVVSAGVKSLLDVPATAEVLESLGVPVLGYRVDSLPLFYCAAGGPPVSGRVESAREAADVAHAHWELGGAGLLLGRAPDEPLDDVEPLIEA